MKSYLDAIMEQPSVTLLQQMEEHMQAELKNAHGAKLSDLANNLKDWGMAVQTDLSGSSNILLMNVATTKELIRQFNRGEWS
jgi:hypothetical protein